MSTFADLLKYLKIYRRYLGWRMYLIFALTIAAALASGFGITLLLPLLKASQSGGTTEDMGVAERLLEDLLSAVGIANSMGGILGFIAVVFLLKGLLQFSNSGYKGYLQAQLLRELKTRLFGLYTEMDYRYRLRQSSGHFINVINQQVNRFFLSFKTFTGFFNHLIRGASYFAFAFAITWKFAALALGVGAILLYVFKYLNAYVRELSRKRSTEMSHLNKLLVQSLQSLKYLISTGQTRSVRSNVSNSVNRLTDYIFRQRLARSLVAALKEPVSVLLVVSLIALQVFVFGGPVESIFVALLLFHRGMQAVMNVQTDWQKTMDRIGSLEMVDEEIQTVEENREDRKEGRKIDVLNDGIEFRDVSFAYSEDEENVIKKMNVEIPANTTVAIVGESGAGKSTLVDMITLLLKPDTGRLEVDGIDSASIDLASWRSKIGYVSQETVIFDDTVANNIGLWEEDEEDPSYRNRIEEAARKAYAHHFIRDLPDGYQTVVGDRGVRLSGGQRQRLFLARELYKEPHILLLDEATSALDTDSERHIQRSIDELRGEVTVVIIAHRLSSVKNADYVYVLEDGVVIEEGKYDHLQNIDGSRFKEMVEMQKL